MLQPFATDFEAEQETYKYDKREYCKTVTKKLNERFEERILGWVPMTLDKVRRKFRAFGEKYKAYLSGKGYGGPPEVFAPLLLVHFSFAGTLFFCFELGHFIYKVTGFICIQSCLSDSTTQGGARPCKIHPLNTR